MALYKPGRPSKFCPTTLAGSKPPSQPGEYRIRDSAGAIAYVGETCDLNRRMQQHIRSGKLSHRDSSTFEYKVADSHSTSAQRRAHERQKIREHQPYLNRSGGGEGRPAGK